MLNDQIRAILGAQFKVIINKMAGGGGIGGRWLYWLLTGIWYLMVAWIAWLVATFLPSIKTQASLTKWLSGGLFLAFMYWQLVPVMLATTGMSLELRRLLVYPVPERRLFAIEVLLRLTTGIEVMILLTGAAAGLIRSPVAPLWGVLILAPFVAFNLLLSAGVRDLLTRLLARRGVREMVVLGIVLVSALPNLILSIMPPHLWRGQAVAWASRIPDFPWPWHATAVLASGRFELASALGLTGFVALAWWFGFAQFHKGLSWDADAVRASQRATAPRAASGIAEAFYRWPGRVFADPLAALVEKELRFLSRAPRFRLVFFMGFSFGIVIWLPMILRGGGQGFIGNNFLVMVSIYAAMLLGEVLFWNSFGFDRTAAQAYYIMPVRLSTVLLAKNITAVVFLLLEVGIVTLVVSLLRLKNVSLRVPESLASTMLLALFLLAIGNLSSTHFPRPIDPTQSWRHSNSGKVQGLMLLLFPVITLPIATAFLAKYAWQSELAFYAVLLSGFVVGLITYSVSLSSAVEAADKRREELLTALARGSGPIE